MSEKHDAMWGGGTGSPGEYIAQQEAEIASLYAEVANVRQLNMRLRAALEKVRVHVKRHERDLAVAKIDAALANKQD